MNLANELTINEIYNLTIMNIHFKLNKKQISKFDYISAN